MAPKDTPTTGTTEDTSATGSDLKAIADTQPDVTTNTRVSQYALDPTMKLQARKIQQPDPKDRNLPGLAAAGMVRSEKYAPADRLERLLPSYKEWIYTGQNLVDEEGKIVGPAYNVETAPLMELARMPATQRMAFLRMLESRGLYGGSKISATGTAQVLLLTGGGPGLSTTVLVGVQRGTRWVWSENSLYPKAGCSSKLQASLSQRCWAWGNRSRNRQV